MHCNAKFYYGGKILQPMVLSRMHCNVEFYDFGKMPHTGIGLHRTSDVVLRHRNTVVGGKCSLPSALLVFSALGCARVNLAKSNVSCPSQAGSVTSKLMTIVSRGFYHW